MAAAAAADSSSTVSSTPNNTQPTLLYKFKITLNDLYHRPRGGRWRRVIVPANFSLLELHVVIQAVFGWENYHLHHFMRNRNRRGRQFMEYVEYTMKDRYNEPYASAETKEERIYKLSDVFSADTPDLEYEYDFGACWGHEVKFEGVVEAEPKLEYPACVQGKWANRMEDHQDEDEEGDFLPGFEGKKFDLKEAQKELQKIYEGKWPLKVNNTTLPKCYLCAFNQCSACNGKCCNYCLKADVVCNPETVANKKKAELEAEHRMKGLMRNLLNW